MQDRPLCEVCQINVTGQLPSGNYRKKCRSCGSANGRATGKTAYRSHKKDYCEADNCPIDPAVMIKEALELHHVDGDKGNDSPDNYLTLCVFCHRVETVKNRHYVNVVYRNKETKMSEETVTQEVETPNWNYISLFQNAVKAAGGQLFVSQEDYETPPAVGYTAVEGQEGILFMVMTDDAVDPGE